MSSPTEIQKHAADLRWLNPRLDKVFLRVVSELQSESLKQVEAIAIADAIRAVAAGGHLSAGEVEAELWEPCQLGGIKVGDVVRVRIDAYPEVAGGNAHNGRRGAITAIRNGIIHVRYSGNKGSGMVGSSAHKPEALQILKTGAAR